MFKTFVIKAYQCFLSKVYTNSGYESCIEYPISVLIQEARFANSWIPHCQKLYQIVVFHLYFWKGRQNIFTAKHIFILSWYYVKKDLDKAICQFINVDLNATYNFYQKPFSAIIEKLILMTSWSIDL